MRLYLLLLLLLASISGYSQQGQTVNWSLVLEKKGELPNTICSFNEETKLPLHVKKNINGLDIRVDILRSGSQIRFSANAKSEHPDSCYFSLKANYLNGESYSYLGEEKNQGIFRQSPHNPLIHSFGDLVKQDVPMIAIKNGAGFLVAVNDAPAFYDNYNTQEFNPEQKWAFLSSGDNGKVIGKAPKYVQIRPYYHHINKKEAHTFNGIIFKSEASSLNNLRKDVLFAITKRWGTHITDRFGATSFASNYMLLRKMKLETANIGLYRAFFIVISNTVVMRSGSR